MPVKIQAPNSQVFDQEPIYAIKRSSRGLRGVDFSDFVKRAGLSLADRVRRMEHRPGERLTHNIALGCTEKTGSNRNGDGFPADACRKYHHTFVKNARVYRDHINKDPSRSYGVIHLSEFNEPMGRIELVTGLNATKEAADRNGGLVADKEVAKLDAGKPIPTSMACRVPEDYCSSCGNPARHRSEYCDESTCDRGGLKNNLGKVASDGHVMHAVNKDPNWFDESSVWRGADRIAYVLGEYEKAAAAGTIKSGAELAEELGLTDPLPSVSSFTRAVPLLKLAVALADLERTFDASSSSSLDGAFAPGLRSPLDLSPFAKTSADRAALVSALTEQKICLPLSDFLTLHYGQPPEKVAHLAASASAHLRGAFSRLVDDPSLEQRCMDSAYSSSAASSERTRIYATKLASLYSWADSSRRQRAVLANLRGVSIPKVAVEKTASHDPAAERLAEEYALYKLAFLAGCGSVVETSPLLTLAVRQNYFNNPLA